MAGDSGRESTGSKVDSNADPLPEDAVRLLSVIESYGGEAATPDIRSQVDFEVQEPRRKILYLVEEYLGPRGLVETHQPEGKPGDWKAKEYMLTEAGHSFIENREVDSSHGGAADERVQELEQRVAQLEADNEKLVETLEAFQNRLGDVESGVETLNNHPLLESQKGVEGINDALISSQMVSVLMSRSDDIQIEDGKRDEYQDMVTETLWENGRIFETDKVIERIGIDT